MYYQDISYDFIFSRRKQFSWLQKYISISQNWKTKFDVHKKKKQQSL